MNKRLPFLLFFSILSCLFSIPASAAEGYLTLDLSEGSIQITALGYSIGSKTEFYRGSYLIVQSGAASPHTISITGGSHQITLSNVHINTTGCAFSISPGADVRLQLADGTNNSLQSGPYSAGLQVPTGAALTIQCTYTDQTGHHCENSCGSLDVIGGDSCAGIGSGIGDMGGAVILRGGIIRAQGGGYAAGIGGGNCHRQ